MGRPRRINVDFSERQIRQINEAISELQSKHPESALARMTKTSFVRLAVAYALASLRDGVCYIHHPDDTAAPDLDN
jgi:hypothetical protein